VPGTSTEVKVSARVLWIGRDAYPLQNIARAQVKVVYPKRGRPVVDYLKAVFKWICLAVLAAIVLALINVPNSGDYVIYGLLFLIAVSTIKLVRKIKKENRKRAYYLLMIQTAGDPQTLLASTDQTIIDQLIETIMAAIDDATVTYHNWITNYGDIVSQYGDNNTGVSRVH
jgi:uncharacterized protein DUF6232